MPSNHIHFQSQNLRNVIVKQFLIIPKYYLENHFLSLRFSFCYS